MTEEEEGEPLTVDVPGWSVDELLDRWQSAWSGHRAEDFAPLCASGVHYEDPLTPEPLRGVSALAEHAQVLWDAFPDVRIQRSGERPRRGSFVAAPCKVLGTHRGALDGLPATSRFLSLHAIFYCELRDRRLLRVRAFFDVYDAAVQLGVLPRRGTLGAKALLALRGFGVRVGR